MSDIWNVISTVGEVGANYTANMYSETKNLLLAIYEGCFDQTPF